MLKSLIKNLGRVRIVSEGEHNSTKAYKILSKVHSNTTKATYISMKDVPAGVSINDTTYWDKLVDDPITTIVTNSKNGLMSSAMLKKLNSIKEETVSSATDKPAYIWIGLHEEYFALFNYSLNTIYVCICTKEDNTKYVKLYLGNIALIDDTVKPYLPPQDSDMEPDFELIPVIPVLNFKYSENPAIINPNDFLFSEVSCNPEADAEIELKYYLKEFTDNIVTKTISHKSGVSNKYAFRLSDLGATDFTPGKIYTLIQIAKIGDNIIKDTGDIIIKNNNEESGKYQLYLDDVCESADKVDFIKTIKSITGWDLVTTKQMIDNFTESVLLKEFVYESQAIEAKDMIESYINVRAHIVRI